MSGDDLHNLFEYFVKIPANIAKGTFGAMNQRLSKDQVHEWLESVCGFRTPEMQRLARDGEPGPGAGRIGRRHGCRVACPERPFWHCPSAHCELRKENLHAHINTPPEPGCQPHP